MFYKKENNNWLVGSIINLPNGQQLNADNKTEVGGWNWFDTEPLEYTEWVNKFIKPV